MPSVWPYPLVSTLKVEKIFAAKKKRISLNAFLYLIKKLVCCIKLKH